MNERIKQLEIQCWEPRQYGPAWFNSTKFAQLIVRECAEFVKQRSDFQSDLGIKTMLKITGQQVKEHFGVEE